MRMLFWFAVAAFIGTLVWVGWYVRRKAEERARAEEARAAAFLMDFAGAKKSPAPAAPAASPPLSATSDVALQKLLFEAAHKAGEAGEHALAIQVYERLLARFPATGFAEPARAAMSALSRKSFKG